MKRYLCVFTGSPTGMEAWQALPEAQRKQREREGMARWKQWVEDHGPSIVEMGGPLSRTKRVSHQGVSDIRNNLAGFMIVQAGSQDEAARMFLAHPHFTLFPGDGVEVMEVLAIPAG